MKLKTQIRWTSWAGGMILWLPGEGRWLDAKKMNEENGNHKLWGEEPETTEGRDQVQAGGCLTSTGGVPEGGGGFGETLV